MTTPRSRAVVVGSLSLFVVLFVLLTFQLSARAPAAGAEHAKARPAPAETRTDAAAEPEEPVYAESEEGAVEYVEPEVEYVEPEPEYVEPEVEEVPPVVTSSS